MEIKMKKTPSFYANFGGGV